ncbi:hypothetical protein SLS58_007333 [Diplodia intermedia]|uniref:NADAR domain-containing protein n=1 Tax=Diplodia intermedia TaxID=856260 RepID=A0ABR3TKH3_9PEZI
MVKPIFFLKADEAEFGWLCQWYAAPFAHEGTTFNCAEQWMMWRKARTAGDEKAAAKILATREPRKQKSLGRKVEGFDEGVWDGIKSQVVEEGNYLKFTQNEALRKMLLDTGERELAEASKFDRVWGIGFAAADAAHTPREEWGENLLGKALVRVRERIRREMEEASGDGVTVRE